MLFTVSVGVYVPVVHLVCSPSCPLTCHLTCCSDCHREEWCSTNNNSHAHIENGSRIHIHSCFRTAPSGYDSLGTFEIRFNQIMKRMPDGTPDLITPLLYDKMETELTGFVSFYGRVLLLHMIGYHNIVHTLKSEGLPMGPNITKYSYESFR